MIPQCADYTQGPYATKVKDLDTFDYVVVMFCPSLSVSRQSIKAGDQDKRLTGLVVFGMDASALDQRLITRKVLIDKFAALSWPQAYGGNLQASDSSVARGGMVEAATVTFEPIFPSIMNQAVVFTGELTWNTIPQGNNGTKGEQNNALTLRNLMQDGNKMKPNAKRVTLKGRIINAELPTLINYNGEVNAEAPVADDPAQLNSAVPPYQLGEETVQYAVFSRPASSLAPDGTNKTNPPWQFAYTYLGNIIEIANPQSPLFYQMISNASIYADHQNQPEVGTLSALSKQALGGLANISAAITGDESVKKLLGSIKQQGMRMVGNSIMGIPNNGSNMLMSIQDIECHRSKGKYVRTPPVLERASQIMNMLDLLQYDLTSDFDIPDSNEYYV